MFPEMSRTSHREEETYFRAKMHTKCITLAKNIIKGTNWSSSERYDVFIYNKNKNMVL